MKRGEGTVVCVLGEYMSLSVSGGGNEEVGGSDAGIGRSGSRSIPPGSPGT